MAEFIKIANINDLKAGVPILVEYDDDDVGIFKLDDGVYAISDICTHDDAPLIEGNIIEGDCIRCPRHGATFNIKTGKQTMPAFAPVPRYHVKIEGDDIYIAPMEGDTC